MAAPPEAATPGEERILPSRYWVTVYYATNRARTGSSLAHKYFGRNNSGHLDLGTVAVIIPPLHTPGEIEAPSLTRLEFRRDPQKHMVLHEVRPLTGKVFFDSVRRKVGSSERKELFVYVHGFDNTFEEAALRGAQLAYDIHFQGAPMIYTWPSAGAGPPAYLRDRRVAEESARHLRHFLDLLAERTGAEAIHVIAHSMGNFVLQTALAPSPDAKPPAWRDKLHQVVLAAADLDAKGMRNLARVLRRPPGRDLPRITAYASKTDLALLASYGVHGMVPFGLIVEKILTLPGLDVIDASLLDTNMIGHDYWARNPLSLQELHTLIAEEWAPEQRTWLRKSADGAHWVYCGSACN